MTLTNQQQENIVQVGGMNNSYSTAASKIDVQCPDSYHRFDMMAAAHMFSFNQ